MKYPLWEILKWYLVGILILILIIILGSSCEVLKKRQEVVKDSVAVAKIDSGAVRVNTTTRTDSLAWWREIINFGRDTTIVVTPTNNIYPTSYIREGGTQRTETKIINYDSLWNNKIDSLVYKLAMTNKSKETKVLSMWQILGLCAGAYIVLQILGKVNISQLFTKK
tara:strand:+ start:188 stop:688 length:501 start_codon:yes stop_codon:yes gene_type:complete